MDNQVHNQIVSFIWGIADDCLRDIYVRGKYRDVILPMTVIRRLDAMLEDSKAAVLDMKKKLDAAGIDNQWPALCNVAGQAFCNASPFRLKDLTSRAKKQILQKDFEAYLDGFSPNVQEILAKFKFRDQIPTMIEADILGAVIEKFVSSDINLSPKPVYKDEAQTILKHPGLDNHGIPRISDGQLLFLLNNVAKMKKDTPLGSRIAEVHNGSSIFTGDAGSGESNARRYLIENDLVEAIIAVPENMFYNTGIGTYIWILSNKKEERRKGKIQLIDATAMKSTLRKNMGKKNCEFTSDIRKEIVRIFLGMEESNISMIFHNEEFGYWNVTLERPLRLRVFPDRAIPSDAFKKADEMASVCAAVERAAKTAPLDEWTAYVFLSMGCR